MGVAHTVPERQNRRSFVDAVLRAFEGREIAQQAARHILPRFVEVDVPQARCVVVGGGQHVAAIRREIHAEQAGGVARKAPEFAAGGDVPQARGLVARCAEQAVPVTADVEILGTAAWVLARSAAPVALPRTGGDTAALPAALIAVALLGIGGMVRRRRP
jgi:LPXTG-motif cell wall-anchored protein